MKTTKKGKRPLYLGLTVVILLAWLCFPLAAGIDAQEINVDPASPVTLIEIVEAEPIPADRQVSNITAVSSSDPIPTQPRAGPCTNLIYDNTTEEGVWYAPWVGYEDLDYGTTTEGGTVCKFSFGYATTLTDPGTITVRFYSGTNSSTCPGTYLAGWNLSGFSGSPDGGAYAYIVDFTIPAGQEFNLPPGAFGYSFEFYNNDTGPYIALGGTGNEDTFWENCSLTSFGGYPTYPWAGFYMQITAEEEALGEIHGSKWNDLDGDGLWDGGEPGLSNWKIFIDENRNGQWDTGEPSDLTDSSGDYAFIDLPAGTYYIAEELQAGWVQTYPAGVVTTRMAGGPSTIADMLTEEELEKIDYMIMDSPPVPPAGIQRSAMTALPPTAVALIEVPTTTWTYGCSATSAGMIFGYYDRTGYADMYTGPTNGGLTPLTDLGQGISTPIPGSCSIIATQNGFDGRATYGHVDDYWIAVDSPGPDPWEGSWTEHTWEGCTADYMGTNQWKWDHNPDGTKDANNDGATTLFYYNDANKLYDYIPPSSAGLPQTALCHGMRLFAEDRGYTVLENYTQRIDTLYSGGFSIADYRAEIDAGRPVMIQVTGHSMVGMGYEPGTNTIYLHDTWDNDVHSMIWGDEYQGMAHQAITVIHLDSLTLPGTHVVELDPGEIQLDIDFGNSREVDWGDAPDSYSTLLASSGPSHVIFALMMGPAIDAEPDGQPSFGAIDDDLNGATPDDEDGVTIPLLQEGRADNIVVNVTGAPGGAKLDAWIDFNGNGVFDHPIEHLGTPPGTSINVFNGDNSVSVTPAAGTATLGTYARFRISINGGLTPQGPATEGEVEDYGEVVIEEPIPCDPPVIQLAESVMNHAAPGTAIKPYGIELVTDPTMVNIEMRQDSAAGSPGPVEIHVTFDRDVQCVDGSCDGGDEVLLSSGTCNEVIIRNNVLTIYMHGANNNDCLTVTLHGIASVSDGSCAIIDPDSVMPDTNLYIKVILGECSDPPFAGTSTLVNIFDLGAVKSQLSKSVTPANCNKDIECDGIIDASDLDLVKSNLFKQFPSVNCP